MADDSSEEWFSKEESTRRMNEMMSRIFHRKATMNFRTGQNLEPPFLSEDELAKRGYPCEEGFGD